MFLLPLLLLILLAVRIDAQTAITRSDSIIVNDVSFDGNETFSDAALEEIVYTRESPSAFLVFVYNYIAEALGSEEEFFDYPNFEEDAKSIKQFYKIHGFFHTKVDKEFTFVNDSTEVDVVFNIEEGKPSFIDSINYRNIERLPPEVKKEIFTEPLIETGHRYDAAILAAEERRIVTILKNNGYPRAYSDSIAVVILLSSDSVTIKLPFFYGKRLYVGQIRDSTVGEDNLNLARKVIYDRLEFKEGDVFSLQKQRKSESNLLRYNIFRGVEAKADIPPITNTTDSLVPVLLILHPLPKRDASITPLPLIQYKENRLYAGPLATLVWRNVFGGAQIAEINATYLTNIVDFAGELPLFGAQQLRGELKFDQPYFFDNYTSLGASVSYTFAEEKKFYEGNFFQFVPNVRRIISENLRWNIEFSLESLLFDLDSTALGGDNPNTQRQNPFSGHKELNYINGIITTSLDFDYTNSLVNPSKGWAFRPTLEEAGLFGIFNIFVKDPYTSTEYTKGEVYFRIFSDLSRNKTMIAGWKLRAGSIFRYGESAREVKPIPVPLTRRYYGGGANSVRGWYPRKLTADPENVDVGSHVLIETSLEVRWQLFPKTTEWILPVDGLWLTLFADAGNVWTYVQDVSHLPPGLATGIGIAYLTSFGPIRIEYGYQAHNPELGNEAWFTERPLELKRGAFHFGFGWAF